MKKNDFAAFIVYVLMFALAMLIGFLVIRGIVSEANSWGIKNAILLVILSVIVGVIFNALLLEFGHLLGAKAGGYTISMWCLFGLAFKKQPNGKFKFTISSFDGLTGETRVVPKDVKKSSLSAYIVFPLLGFLLEIIGCVILMAFAERDKNTSGTASAIGWMYLSAIVFMTVGGMIYLYDIFPAHLDAETDGYRMTILNKPINREAYNQMLIARNRTDNHLAPLPAPVYDDVTDFTWSLNVLAVYDAILREKYIEAIKIVQRTLDTSERVSQATKDEAMAMKLSIVLLTLKRDDGKIYYDENCNNEQRKYIATLPDVVTARCYILISGVLDGNQNETNYAIDKLDKLLKKVPDVAKPGELKLLNLSLTRVKTLHPDWTLDNVVALMLAPNAPAEKAEDSAASKPAPAAEAKAAEAKPAESKPEEKPVDPPHSDK
ncbi:MAG: hypothetical protein BWY98_00802 [Tenericutes bacterium ADurb.BinA155]|nr:MAG: hypothetical protein BWY98_00802 [Tenericutes bacterium ADurb.BinA155]